MAFFIQRKYQYEQWISFSRDGPNYKPGGEPFRKYIDRPTSNGWYIDEPFDEQEDAAEAITDLIKETGGNNADFRVINEQGVVFAEVSKALNYAITQPAGGTDTMGTEYAGYVEQPLTIPRQALIDTLTTKLGEEQQARADAQAAITKRRQAAQDAVASLSSDEVLNLVINRINSNLDEIVAMVDEAQKSGRLKSQDMKPNDTETALEKYVRVLTLANNDVIEVKPTDPLYPLL